MTIGANDFQLTAFFVMEGTIQAQNVFFYTMDTGTGDAADLCAGWVDDFWSDLKEILVDDTVCTGVEAFNLAVPTDFSSVAVNEAGAMTTSSPLVPFLAAAFRLNRASREFRSGQKRFGQVGANDWNGVELDSGAAARYASVGQQLVGGVSHTLDTYTPKLPRRELQDPDEDHPKAWYKLMELGSISSVSGPFLTTQNTRKT